MYGRSPLNAVVVCDPITVLLNICPPPEHLRLYSVITPLGSSGGPQLRVNDVELMAEAEQFVGGDLGSVKMRRWRQLGFSNRI